MLDSRVIVGGFVVMMCEGVFYGLMVEGVIVIFGGVIDWVGFL